jgi:competence protein ComEC
MSKAAATETFSRYPMFWLAACFAVGILAAHLATVPFVMSMIVCVSAAIAAFLLRRNHYGTLFVALAFAAAGAVTLGAQNASVGTDRLKVLYDGGSFLSGTPVEVEGVLARGLEPSVDGEFLMIRAETVRYHGDDRKISGNARVFVPGPEGGSANAGETDLRSDISNLKYGSRVRIACLLEREDEYLNPGVQPKREILDRQDIDAVCSLKSSMLVEHIADESVFLPLAWVYDQRTRLIADFQNNLSPSSAGVMIASLLGDKYFLDKDTADLFREGGTFHILVISGLHITFIGGLLLLFVRWLTRRRWVQFAATTAVLWGYTLAVGADVPVVRAAVMFTVVLFGYAIHRRGSPLNSLGLCGLVLLIWRPQDLLNPSFQLTFVSVGAIVAIAYPLLEHLRKIGSWTPTPDMPFPPTVPNCLRYLCEKLYWSEKAWAITRKRSIWTGGLIKTVPLHTKIGDLGQKIVRYVFEAVLVSAIVQITMLPLSIIYFHRVAVAGVLLNLWVSFFIAIESFAAVAGAIASHFSELFAIPIFWIANAANGLTLLVPRSFAWAEWSSFRIPAYGGPGRLIYVLFFLTILWFACLAARWKPFELKRPAKSFSVLIPAIFVFILTAVIIAHPFSAPAADGRLHIDFLDVGQGDSALVTFPNGETWLVDGGGKLNYRKAAEEEETFTPDSRSIGESVVSEVLWAKGYSHIDHLTATHADADHIQGLSDVAKNFSVGSAIFGRLPSTDPELADLLAVVSKRRIPIDVISRGDRVYVEGAIVEVLYPAKTDDPDAPSDNDHSIVLRIVFGSRAFLLTGDIERVAEQDMLVNGGTVASDLVKVAHHGSRTSSTPEFIAAAHPQYAVISVGRHSPFGHPHQEVVERWSAAGASVLTTGENGMISVSTDGKDLSLNRYVPE